MDVLKFALYSVPEEFLIVALTSTLAGYNITQKKIVYILISLSLAVFIELVRIIDFSLPVRLTIQFLFFIALLKRGTRLALLPLIVSSVTTLLLLEMNEFLIYNIFSRISGFSYPEITSNLSLLLPCAWTNLFITFLFLFFTKKYSFSLFKSDVAAFGNNTRSYLLFFTFYGTDIIAASILERDKLISSEVFIFVFALQLLSVLVIYELIKTHQKETQLAVHKEFLKHIHSLFTTIRAQRHDFANHIQVIYILVKQKEYEKLTDYVEELVGEINSVNKVLISDNPGLSALLQVKTAQFSQDSISLKLDIRASLTDIEMPIVELNQIIGNLLDNAADAIKAANYPSNEIFLHISKVNDKIELRVRNDLPVIPFHLQKKIFEYGFSTKPEHSGIGLAIVKQLVEKNKATIHLISNERAGTEFVVLIPSKGMIEVEQKTG
jgi:two-component system sensor histidine kinase AgrC